MADEVDRRGEHRPCAGCHIAGAEAPELIQLAAIAVKAELTKAQWDATCAVHPTAAEEFVLMGEPVSHDNEAPA